MKSKKGLTQKKKISFVPTPKQWYDICEENKKQERKVKELQTAYKQAGNNYAKRLEHEQQKIKELKGDNLGLKAQKHELEKENERLRESSQKIIKNDKHIDEAVQQAIQFERDKIPFFLDEQAKKGLLTPKKADEFKKAFKETV